MVDPILQTDGITNRGIPVEVEDSSNDPVYSNELSNIFKNIELTPSLKSFCKKLRRRLRLDWDAVLGIEGPDPGVGKTCLNIQLGYGTDPENFNLNTSVFYLAGSLSSTAKKVEKQFNQLPQYAYYMIDEGEDALYKLQWFNALQQSINLMYMKERKQNKATGICIPRFLDFNELFRNYRIKYRIYIIDRGVAVAYLRDSDKDVLDPWHVKENQKIKEKFFRNKQISERTVDERLEAERRTVNYWFDFTFNDLPPEVWVEYKRIRAEHKSDQSTYLEKYPLASETRWKQAVLNLYTYLIKDVNLTDKAGKPVKFNQLKMAKVSGVSAMSINRARKYFNTLDSRPVGDSGVDDDSDQQGQDESQ